MSNDELRILMGTRTRSAHDAQTRRAQSPGSEAALQLSGVRKTYSGSGVDVTALDGLTLAIARGSFTAVMGPSGSGKTTLMQCSAGLDRPSEGQVLIDGIDVTEMNETARTKFRRGHIGFVFQQFNLLPALTVLQNVALPMRMLGQQVGDKQYLEIFDREDMIRWIVYCT